MSTPTYSEIPKSPLKAIFATNQTVDAASNPVATSTAPTPSTTTGVITGGGSMLKVIGFGTDAANETFSCNIWGWSRTPSATPIWIPTRLMTATFTLGTQTGAAGADILDTELIADTVVAGAFQPTFGGDNWIGLLSPADNTTAMILLPTIGTEYIEFDVFDVSTASCNVLAGVI